jgi:RNA polymerase sigma-70 factor (ECF subfamily)
MTMNITQQRKSAPPPAAAPAEDHEHAEILRLIQTNYGGLLGVIQRKLNNRELAADLLNEAIVIALEHLRSGRLGESERIAGYVFTITMNLLRNYQRNMNNRQDLRAATDSLPSLGHPSEVDLDQQRIKQLVRRVIDSLETARDREIVRRYYLDEEQKEGICAALGVSSPNFDKIVYRARQRLKSLLESRGYRRGDFFCLSVCLV